MVSALTKKQRQKMTKKIATGAANVMRKTVKAPTPAERQKMKATTARRRVKAIVANLTPAKRKSAIKNLQKRKKARAAKKP